MSTWRWIHEDGKNCRAKKQKIDMNSPPACSHWLLAVPDRIFFNRNAILKEGTKLIVLFIRRESPLSSVTKQTTMYLKRRWSDARVDKIGNRNRRDENARRSGRRLGECAPNKELQIKKGMLRRCNISLLSSGSRGSSIRPLCFLPTSNFHTIKGSPPTCETYLRRAVYFLDHRRV